MAAKAARVNGLPELISKLHDLGAVDTLERISYRATFGAARDLREAARANAMASTQTRTGALSRGFAIKRLKDGTRRGYTVGVRFGRNKARRATDDPYYWWMLEFGTRYIAPMGFMARALDVARSTAPGQIVDAGRKAVLDSGNRALRKFGSGRVGK